MEEVKLVAGNFSKTTKTQRSPGYGKVKERKAFEQCSISLLSESHFGYVSQDGLG